MPRRARVSPDRILAAAAAEFAGRGGRYTYQQPKLIYRKLRPTISADGVEIGSVSKRAGTGMISKSQCQ